MSFTIVLTRTSTPIDSSCRWALAREVARQVQQDAVGRLDEDDAHLGGVDAAEIVPHDVAAQFLARAGHLDAGRTAADDDDGHELLELVGVGGHLGLLEGEARISRRMRIASLTDLSPGANSRPVGMAEVAGHAAERDDEVIIGDRPVGQDDGAGVARSTDCTSAISVVTLVRIERIERSGLAISTAERVAVATW